MNTRAHVLCKVCYQHTTTIHHTPIPFQRSEGEHTAHTLTSTRNQYTIFNSTNCMYSYATNTLHTKYTELYRTHTCSESHHYHRTRLSAIECNYFSRFVWFFLFKQLIRILSTVWIYTLKQPTRCFQMRIKTKQ